MSQQRKLQRKKEAEEKKQTISCNVCGCPDFFNNPVLQQIGLVICANPECGSAYCPVVDQIIEAKKNQAEGLEAAQAADKAKQKGAMSQEEFDRIREENKDLIIKP